MLRDERVSYRGQKRSLIAAIAVNAIVLGCGVAAAAYRMTPWLVVPLLVWGFFGFRWLIGALTALFRIQVWATLRGWTVAYVVGSVVVGACAVLIIPVLIAFQVLQLARTIGDERRMEALLTGWSRQDQETPGPPPLQVRGAVVVGTAIAAAAAVIAVAVQFGAARRGAEAQSSQGRQPVEARATGPGESRIEIRGVAVFGAELAQPPRGPGAEAIVVAALDYFSDDRIAEPITTLRVDGVQSSGTDYVVAFRTVNGPMTRRLSRRGGQWFFKPPYTE